MVEKVQSTTKEENLDKEPNDELLELIADHYVGSYFQAVAGQILHRKINFDDTHTPVAKKLQLLSLSNSYTQINTLLARNLRIFLLNRIAKETENTAAADWRTPFEILPKKPDGESDVDVSTVTSYLEKAAAAFLECRRDVPDSTYGGPVWANICDSAATLWKEGDHPTEGTFLRIFGLEHNTGQLFEGKAKQVLDAKQLRLPLREAIERIGAPLKNSDQFIKKWMSEYVSLEKLVRSLKSQWQDDILSMMERTGTHADRYDE